MAIRNQSPESPKKKHNHAQIRPYRSPRPNRQKIEQHKHASQLMSRKTTKMYVLTTKMASPTHRDASTLKEHILGPFTGFTLSTIINQKRAMNTSLENVTQSQKYSLTE